MAMAKSDVKLLGIWPSPFSLMVRLALRIKSIDYEFIEEDLSNKSDLLLEVNPVHKKIPVLIHNGKSICESLVIVQYIDELWTTSNNGPSILPSDPYDRATARFWVGYICDKVYPTTRAIFSSVANGEEAEKTATLLEEADRSMALLENAFVNCSKGKRFFGGDSVGCVDIVLGSFVLWIKAIEKMGNLSLIGESNTPNLWKWAQHFCADDAVKDVLPSSEKYMEFAKAYTARVMIK